MPNFLAQKNNTLAKIPAHVYLWVAVIIFGASGAVTRALTEAGQKHAVHGANPVSLCNVLFVGNICALLVLIIIYGRELNLRLFKALSWWDWLTVMVVAILSGAVAPGFFFAALDSTEVNNVILIGRLEPPLVLALSAWFLRERVNRWQVSGAFVCLFGVFVTVLLQVLWEGMTDAELFGNFGSGEILTAVAASAAAFGTVIGKLQNAQIPVVVNNIFRTIIGTIVFFFMALILYGQDHFMEVFSPFLWKWMLIYGTVIVVVGQYCWLIGLRKSTGSMASLVSSFTPIAGIIAAYFVLGEVPSNAQYLGGSIIMAGIFLSQRGSERQQRRLNSEPEVENNLGFKGV